VNVAVVGGGITGLAAAWFLREQADVTLFEATGRVGGKIRTSDFCGRPVDEGADAFITRTPDAVDLARQLGLADELVAPAAGHASLWARGRLRPLPPNVLGVPTDLVALARSGILSPAAVARASLDVVLPRRDFTGDRAVADVIGARFGRGAAIGLVDPLLGGIHAGHTDSLSIDAVAPQLAAAARRHRSLSLALAADRRAAPLPPDGSPPSVFLTPRAGVGQLVERLADKLAGLVVDRRVDRIEPGPDGAWLIGDRTFDGVVLAVPAPAAAALVGRHSPDALAELGQVRHSSVVLVTMAYDASSVPERTYTGSGFLVPRPEGRLMTACTFGSNKWPHWSGPDVRVVRVSAGRTGDERPFELREGPLVDALHRELTEAIGVTGRPREVRVSRWPDAFAQYEPGHLDRVERIEAALAADMPGVVVAGAAYRGVGIPACVASARRAAAAVSTPRPR
jgi:oxygen-dependent protoporphyrinogen oxidase